MRQLPSLQQRTAKTHNSQGARTRPDPAPCASKNRKKTDQGGRVHVPFEQGTSRCTKPVHTHHATHKTSKQLHHAHQHRQSNIFPAFSSPPSAAHLGDDEGENESAEDLGEENATRLVQGLVHEQHLVLIRQLAREEVGDADHQDERVHDRVR